MHQVQTTRRVPSIGPLGVADVVTCSRVLLTLVLGVLSLLDVPRGLLGAVAAIALVTDFVDGRLARATGSVSARGARLDQEADALLVLVLSIIAMPYAGPWVLGVGLARYAFGAVFALVPALRTPPVVSRRWCKVVAAVTGITLAVVVGVPLPRPVATVVLAVVAVLLAESFLHEALDRWRAPRPPVEVRGTTTAAVVAVWIVLLLPGDQRHLLGSGVLRLPLEILLLVALALLPRRWMRVAAAAVAGVVLGLVLLLTALDLGFQAVFTRGFDPVGDWSYLLPGVGVLGDSIGVGWAWTVAGLIVLLALAVQAVLPLAVLRLVEVARAHRRRALASAAAYGVVGALLAVAGAPAASTATASLIVRETQQVRADLADSRAFGRAIATDPYAARAADDPRALLAGLAGKDVLVVFVESYGRVAIQGTSYSVGVRRVLDRGTAQLTAAGYRQRSAFLTSPTYGAGSWLAHSTLQSGLWVDSQRRYRQLLGAHRLTLTDLFGRAGWHTVFDVPADTEDWPEGRRFYRFQRYYDSRNVGYRGPAFGYAPVPDQYTLAELWRRELAPRHRRPVMAEVDLVSSHHPWTPLPTMVPWDRVGDGSVYAATPQTPTSAQVFRDPAAVRQKYGESVQYSWTALISFLRTHRDPRLVLLVLGDHQPHTYVSGRGVGHDVPVTLIARDPAVTQRVAGWGWQDGLRPRPDAPVWRMDAFRDRFLAAFGAAG